MPKINDAARNASCDPIVDLLDLGSGANGTLEIRTGDPPASLAAADSGTLLAVHDLPDPAFGSAGAVNPGEAVGNAIDDVTALTDGTPAHWRAKDKDGVPVLQGGLSATGGGASVTYDNVAWVESGISRITSFVVTVPEGDDT